MHVHGELIHLLASALNCDDNASEVDEAGIDEEERLPAGLTVSEAYSPGRTSASFHRTDVNNSANLSMVLDTLFCYRNSMLCVFF